MDLFKQLDRNGDGKVTEEDFVKVCEMVGIGFVGKIAMKQVFKRLDKNHNGTLEISEAMAAFEQVHHLYQMTQGQ